jgi:hypothetical protein
MLPVVLGVIGDILSMNGEFFQASPTEMAKVTTMSPRQFR